MELSLWVGSLGSLILLMGAAYPDSIKHKAYKSPKNWLFTVGNILMLVYAIFGYLQSGSPFFVFLELLLMLATAMMLLDVEDWIDAAVIGTGGLGFVIWSLFLGHDWQTLLFILGLVVLGLGYALKRDSKQRYCCLALGSLVIAIYSLIVQEWVFFSLNLFFALFSGFYFFRKN